MIKSSVQKGKYFQFDVLVIGSGISGLIYVLNLLSTQPKTQIALVTKKTLSDSNSYYAQGGIASSVPQLDAMNRHLKDTLRAGDGLSIPDVARHIIENSSQAIQALKKYGVRFDSGELGQEGGHSERRIYHAGDRTGQAIIEVLIKKICAEKNVKVFEYHTAVNLITQNKKHQPKTSPEVVGCYVLDEKQNKIHTFISKITLLATGGAGKVYRYTTNPDTATGDGLAMAYRAGARLGNLEFYQFHPTLLYHRKVTNFLISEAVRGEGAYLLNADSLKRFMYRYAPKRKELATRDIVARAIFNEIEHSAKKYVYLDIRHRTREFLQKRFPQIFSTLFNIGIDMSHDLIPVVPAAHYLCGGILTDVNGQTDLCRLYAIGETAFTGLHGANRLASNSLLECVVMANLAAQKSAQALKQEPTFIEHTHLWDSKSVVNLRRASQINAHWRGLRGEMTSYAGIVRTKEGLFDLLKLIRTRRNMIEDYYWKYSVTRDLVELRNIAQIAELIVLSALKREESRGGHYREDFPQKQKHASETILEFKEAKPVLE
ncbi:MAG: L-aspartate oxidase [Gammaproteobacteria bacterium]|nr:L-aspartate oxidase [Gammaproteobacteria bacterium]